ncbi:MAG: DUF3224 domain-containing protein [Gammaproteobacteria bacterium]|nr:DUF3224 domain-containing protein [Gammaproteobacteria bacterium]
MAQPLKGVFQITNWDESPYHEGDDGSKLSHAKIKQSYSGEIEGTSETQYLMSYQSPTSAVFVGHETVTGKTASKSGSFVIQHNGTFENGVAKSTFQIILGSGRDGFIGIEGDGYFESTENGQSNYTLVIRR